MRGRFRLSPPGGKIRPMEARYRSGHEGGKEGRKEGRKKERKDGREEEGGVKL